jgi:ribonucleoside-triphosphate reductase
MSAEEADQILLFGTHTCPNCELAVRMLDDMHVEYEEIFAEEQPELAQEYGIATAPTLIVGGQTKITGFGPIRKYLMEHGRELKKVV